MQSIEYANLVSFTRRPSKQPIESKKRSLDTVLSSVNTPVHPISDLSPLAARIIESINNNAETNILALPSENDVSKVTKRPHFTDADDTLLREVIAYLQKSHTLVVICEAIAKILPQYSSSKWHSHGLRLGLKKNCKSNRKSRILFSEEDDSNLFNALRHKHHSITLTSFFISFSAVHSIHTPESWRTYFHTNQDKFKGCGVEVISSRGRPLKHKEAADTTEPSILVDPVTSHPNHAEQTMSNTDTVVLRKDSISDDTVTPHQRNKFTEEDDKNLNDMLQTWKEDTTMTLFFITMNSLYPHHSAQTWRLRVAKPGFNTDGISNQTLSRLKLYDFPEDEADLVKPKWSLADELARQQLDAATQKMLPIHVNPIVASTSTPKKRLRIRVKPTIVSSPIHKPSKNRRSLMQFYQPDFVQLRQKLDSYHLQSPLYTRLVTEFPHCPRQEILDAIHLTSSNQINVTKLLMKEPLPDSSLFTMDDDLEMYSTDENTVMHVSTQKGEDACKRRMIYLNCEWI